MTNHLSTWEQIRRKFFRRGPKYTTNFVKTPKGNGIAYGSELEIRVAGAEVVTAKLYDPLNNRVYSIDQSHIHDEDNDAETVNFTMKSKLHPSTHVSLDNYQLPGGDYALLIWWYDMDTNKGGMYRDKFVIFNKPVS